MKILVLFSFALLNLSSAILSAQPAHEEVIANLQSPDFATKVDKLVRSYTDLDIFSGVVLVAYQGNPVYHKAFGLADRVEGRAVNLQTHFDIGSMNKSFTKVAVLKLIEEGKLSPEDKIGQFFKGFKDPLATEVTVGQLLNHTSGLGDYHSPEYFDLPVEEKTIAKRMEFIRKLPLHFPPGEEQEYSNAGYVILGAILEKVTDKEYVEVIYEMVVEPLSLSQTYLGDKYTVPNRAVGYFTNMWGETVDNEWLSEKPGPDGGFYSTSLDLLRFYRAYHYGEDLWSQKVRELDDMYPFYAGHMDSGGAMTHAGGFEGANTVHYEILRDDISVIVLANMDEPVAENLGAGILAILRGKDPEKPALPAVIAVFEAYQSKGAAYVENHFDDLTKNFHPTDPKDLILNRIGYELLFKDKKQESVEVFKLNTRLFPEVANCWDSLGEGLLVTGEREQALEAYQKALSLDPALPSALEAISRLEKK